MIRLLLLLATIFLFLASLAQSPYAELGGPIEVEHYDFIDYDAGHQNWKIRQSPQGLIYVANTVAVLEYDGNSWRSILPDIPKSVRSLDIDKQGRVFVGGANLIGCLLPDAKGQLQYRSLMPLVPEKFQPFGAALVDICNR